jgi:hypothetical protein
MNNQQLEDVKYHKHLGVTISDDGSWNKHIELVIDKAYSRLNILPLLTIKNILVSSANNLGSEYYRQYHLCIIKIEEDLI